MESEENPKTIADEEAVHEEAAPEEPKHEEPAAPAPVPPAAETQPVPKERRLETVMHFAYSDVATIPVGIDGKEFVLEMQRVDMDTKEVLDTQRSLVKGFRPTAGKVIIHRLRDL